MIALLFLHIRKHRRISNDMEILVFEGGRKDKLEIMCDFKQPIFFQINTENENLMDKCNYDSMEGQSGPYDMNFIKENGLYSFFENDFLRPSLNRFENQYTDYSILVENSEYKYDISYRNYLLATQGQVVVTLVPPINIPKVKKDYYEMKFLIEGEISPEKTLPITMKPGDCLYIPSLWGYKTTFEEKSSAIQFKYKTFLNILSYIDYYGLHFLQKMNTTYRFKNDINKSHISL